MNELNFIEWIREGVSRGEKISLGIGDDAAEVLVGSGKSLVTTDMLMDGAHFDLSKDSAELAGRKAMAVNLSDMAAMAGRPVAAFISAALPRDGGDLAKRVFNGALEMANAFGVTIAGGDTNSWEGKLVVNITLLGEPLEKGALLRSGARSGDSVMVTGTLGGSILGRHLRFQPRVLEAQRLHSDYDLTSMIDLSDGLALDLGRVGKESGVGAILERAKIPISPAAQGLKDGIEPIQHAMCDGEDFELCFTASAEESEKILKDQPFGSKLPITKVGVITPTHGICWDGDNPTPIKYTGFEHKFR